MLAILKRLLSPKWPQGEPLVQGGFRWGTRLADGRIVGAPGVTFHPYTRCGLCQQQLDQADQQQKPAERIATDAEGGCDARV